MIWESPVGNAAWWAKWTRRDTATGCLLYAGKARLNDGHVQVSRGGGRVLLHRMAWEQAYGPIPLGMKVCHRCDTPHCAEATHLFLGTQKDNLRDMFAKGRARPRGKATAALTDFPIVSGRVNQALATSGIREHWLTRCHCTSYRHHGDADSMSSCQCHASTKPPLGQPVQTELALCPDSGTVEPASRGLSTGVEVSPYCAPVPTSQADR